MTMVRTDNGRPTEHAGQWACQPPRTRRGSATGEPVPRPDDEHRRDDHDGEQPEVLLQIVGDHVEAVDEHDGDRDEAGISPSSSRTAM